MPRKRRGGLEYHCTTGTRRQSASLQLYEEQGRGAGLKNRSRKEKQKNGKGLSLIGVLIFTVSEKQEVGIKCILPRWKVSGSVLCCCSEPLYTASNGNVLKGQSMTYSHRGMGTFHGLAPQDISYVF